MDLINKRASFPQSNNFDYALIKRKSHLEEFKNILIQLKRGIWIYFFLLIFEGAIRKWILPGLSDALLVIRDPLALWLILKAQKNGLLPSNIYLKVIVYVTIIGIFTALFFGHGNLLVALYGARIFLLQFPVIFVIGAVYDRRDVLRLGKIIIWLSIPMAILTALQFYSPQSAWVNRGIGGNIEGGGFSGALGYFRPPGTFSFTNGNVSFFGLVSSFLLYFWLESKYIKPVVLALATLALMTAIPFSISRTLFYGVVITLLFAAAAIIKRPRLLSQAMIIAFVIFVSFIILGTTGFFKTSTAAFTARFEAASQSEGEVGITTSISDRIFGTKQYAVFHSPAIPFWGYGLGLGTNVGARLLTGGRTFLIAEEEWGRLIGELGPTLGFSIIILRLSLFIKMGRLSFKKLTNGDLLPWMLLSFCLINLPAEQWAQPASLGFTVLISGLILACLNDQKMVK